MTPRSTSPDAVRVREQRAVLVSLGLCPYCGGRNRAERGKEACRECASKRLAQGRERRRQRLAAGKCSICNRERGEGGHSTLCPVCLPRVHRNHAIYHQRQREAGICPECGQKTEGGRVYCAVCSKEHGERKRVVAANAQKARAACFHPAMHPVKLRVWNEMRGEPARVRATLYERCPHCRQKRQKTIWANPERVHWLLGNALNERKEGE